MERFFEFLRRERFFANLLFILVVFIGYITLCFDGGDCDDESF